MIKEAENKGFKVARIEGINVSETNLRSRIKNKKPSFIFFNGHGSDTSLFNNQEQEFINVDSADVFKEIVTYAIACNCLVKLGPAAIENGGYSFIGYKNPFWIARDHKYEATPLKDKIARPIMECSNIIVKSLLKGNTVEQSVKKSHENAKESILSLINSKEPLAPASLQALVANDSALDFKGDASAKIM
ncbi:hypothetical protein HYW20_07355 [Candidatus Woesearchaeota archaeon]|nr:hypothetical protein [Candidatus Woesearchaeota archaeon]